MNDREQLRTRLRDAARALDPIQPEASFKQGFYRSPPDGGSHAKIVDRVRFDPQTATFFLGGIGSGKTTELLKAKREIEREQLAHPFYIPLDGYFDLGRIREGFLVALAGLAMLQVLVPSVSKLDAQLDPPARLLHAAVRAPRESESALLWPELMGGSEPSPPQSEGQLRKLLAPVVSRWKGTPDRGDVVLLIDALDRRPFEDFLTATMTDGPILKEMGVGVCIAGALNWRRRIDAEFAARWDRWWLAPSHDPTDPKNAAFLAEVLEARAPEIFSGEVKQRLAELSGGVMRDLVDFASESVQQGAFSHARSITQERVTAAAAQFRGARLDSLSTGAREALMALVRDGTQPPDSLGELLDDKGCVLFRDRRWEAHPLFRTLRPQNRAA